MSYIGKNPEADSVKLKGSATEPSGTAVDGQVYFNTGAGSISKGMKVYKNSQFVAIDKQLGDAETMQLLKAADIPAIDFSLSVTSTTVGGNNAVPFEGTSGDFDGTAAFTNSSTGDALLTDDSADLVFHYTTQATNSADNDFWGIPLTVPRAFRGGNLVLEFKYRTEIATGTMDNGYFNIAIQDRSAMILQTQASTISAGAIAAGSNVLLTGKTYANPVTSTTLTVAVGDRVFVESGTGTAGSQTNDIVDCYITSVSSTDNNVTLSKDIVAVQSGKFVTGWLTGYDAGGQLNAFASDTNKDGTSKKIQFKTDADTQQVSLWFFVKGTSTVKHELFFDNVLLSGNKFLQASTIVEESAAFYGQNATFVDFSFYYDNTRYDTTGELVTITNSSTEGFKILANKDCYVYAGFNNLFNSNYDVYQGWTLNGARTTALSPANYGSTTNNVINVARHDSSTGHNTTEGREFQVYIKLSAGDYLIPQISSTSNPPEDKWMSNMLIKVESVSNKSVVLESQDEIFTDWNDYTPTFEGFGTPTQINAQWRRVGSTMQVQYEFVTGTVASTNATLSLPSGYNIDFSHFGTIATAAHGYHVRDATTTTKYFPVVVPTAGNENKVYFSRQDGSYSPTSIQNANTLFSSTEREQGHFSVPIQGFNANFNPLLSMPLVDLGTPAESYKTNSGDVGSFWDSGTGNSYQWDEALLSPVAGSPALASSKLLTIADRTSGTNTVTAITAKQDIILNISMTKYINSGSNVGFYWGGTDTSLTLNQAAASSQYHATSWSGKLNAGDYIYAIGQAGPGASTGRVGGASISAQKLMSGNMAHIIKPAVAQARYEVAQNTVGGQAVTGSWQIRDINLLRGETWFVSLASNKLTFQPGTYKMQASAFFTNTNNTTIGFYDNTNSKFLSYGQTGYNSGAGADAAERWVSGVFTFTAETDVYIKYQVSSNNATCDLGQANNFSGVPEVYLNCLMEKLK